MSPFTFFWNKIVEPKDTARIKTLRVPSLSENNNIAYADGGNAYHKLDVYSQEENFKQPKIYDYINRHSDRNTESGPPYKSGLLDPIY